MNNKMQSGRSMIEMLGVLAIVGILTVGGFSLVSKMTTSNQTNSVMDEISGLASRVKHVARDLDSIDVASVCKAKAYPDTLECDGCSCSSFGGSADVEYSVAGASYPALFTLTVSNLSDEMCMTLFTSNWGSENTTGFMGISGTGNTSSNDAIVKAAALCNGDNSSLTFTFR